MSFSSPSSDFVLLATSSASSSASVSFDGYFSSTYKNYKILISNYYPATVGSTLNVRYRRSNADITTGNYGYINNIGNVWTGNPTGGGVTSYGNEGQTSSPLDGWVYALNQSSPYTVNAELTLHDPLGTDNYKWINAIINHGRRTSGDVYIVAGTSHNFLYDATTALSGISFFASSGNMTRGNFKLYGIK